MKKLLVFLIPVLLVTACQKNHSPVISDISCTPASGSAGTVFTLRVTASDEDGDVLTYLWKAGAGSFTTETNLKEVLWKSPVSSGGKTDTLTVVVTDGKIEVSRQYPIILGIPEMGNLRGKVSYTNFNIPIPAVTVAVGENTATSDDNGYFSITGIPVGDYTFVAAKTDFTTLNLPVKIKANDTLRLTIEITSVKYTSKLSGTITDQDSIPQEGAQIVVLNPDGTESKLKTTTNMAGYYRLWYIPFGERTFLVSRAEMGDYSFDDLRRVFNFQEVETTLNLKIHKNSLRGYFTDPRDRHSYPYKTIGDQTWLTENLAWLPAVSPSAKLSVDDPLYYVYDYQGTDTVAAKASTNFTAYGVLYNWQAANTACPPGWHLPTHDVAYSGLIGTLGSQAGKKMKSTSGWTNYGNGDNTSGFTGLPAGRVNDAGDFVQLRDAGFFWTSSMTTELIYYEGLQYDSDLLITRGNVGKIGCSVRCIRDK